MPFAHASYVPSRHFGGRAAVACAMHRTRDMQIDSPRAYFEALAKRKAEPRLHNAVGAWEFDIDNAGSWTIHVDHGALRVTEGFDPAPTVRVRFDQSEFMRLARGEEHENLVTAMLRGEILGFQGDVAFAQKMQTLIPLPEGEEEPS